MGELNLQDWKLADLILTVLTVSCGVTVEHSLAIQKVAGLSLIHISEPTRPY